MAESESEPGEKPKQGGFLFMILLVLGVGGALGAMQVLGAKDKEPPKIAKPVEPTRPPSGAFAEGGRPQVDGPARVVFEQALPSFVFALDRWIAGRLPAEQEEDDYVVEARAEVIGAARKAGFPPELMERLERVLSLMTDAARVKDEELDDIGTELFQSTLALNDALASASLGFFVESDLRTQGSRRLVLIFSFEILRIVMYRSLGHDIRCLRVRRLDNINWTFTLLGFTSSMRRDAIVLDHKLDGYVIDLLPALAPEMDVDPFYLPDEDKQKPWFTPFRKRASQIIRDELGHAANADELKKLGELLARRIEIYEHWGNQLSNGINLPKTIELSWNYRAEMQGLATHGEMDELDEIQEALTGKAMRQAFADVHDHFAQSVERHETQHRLDLADIYTLPMPETLEEYVGELPDGYRGQGNRAASTLAELSAYLSELARDELTPRLNLALLAGHALNKRSWGTAESYTALAIFEGLAEELGMQHTALVVSRRIDRAEVVRLFLDLSQVPPGRMREAAAKTWERFFDRPLPELELVAR